MRTLRSLGLTQVAGIAALVVVLLLIVVVPALGLYHPYGQHLTDNFVPPLHEARHPLGTDNLGRDILSRLSLAARITLSIVVGVIAANAVIGTVIGVVSGYVGGRLDNVLMAIADVQLAMPLLLVLIALAAAMGPSVWLMIITLACTYWVGYARVARSMAMSLKSRDFVASSRIQGGSMLWILRTHVVPNLIGEIFILAASDLGAIILLTSSFDFLGLGVQAPTPSLGLMISEGQKYLRQHADLALVPGLVIFLVVCGVNIVSSRFTHEAAGSVRLPLSTKGGRR